MSAAQTQPGHDTEFSSRRIFLPPPPAPLRAEIFRDLLNKLGLRREANRLALKHAPGADGMSILHAGCGDGALTMELKRRWPKAEIEGVDPEVDALKNAGERTEEAGLRILFQKGYLQDLPSAAERHDAVVCVLGLYRLRGEDRSDAFTECARVLSPGGRLLLVDFAKPCGGLKGWFVRRLAHHEKGIADQQETGLAELCKLGGFHEIAVVGEGAFGLQAVTCRKEG
ncbi:MAG: class I SAM-dependent methyltransferase [Planctomycetota bacterium]|nr:class I SAM-dependent methyltransferase [Planctomycetota bacterium]